MNIRDIQFGFYPPHIFVGGITPPMNIRGQEQHSTLALHMAEEEEAHMEEEAHVEEEAPKKLDRLSSEDDSEEKGAP
jgi:hypothetical protein